MTQGGAREGLGLVMMNVRHFQRHTENHMRSEAGQNMWDVGDRPQLGCKFEVAGI